VDPGTRLFISCNTSTSVYAIAQVAWLFSPLIADALHNSNGAETRECLMP